MKKLFLSLTLSLIPLLLLAKPALANYDFSTWHDGNTVYYIGTTNFLVTGKPVDGTMNLFCGSMLDPDEDIDYSQDYVQFETFQDGSWNLSATSFTTESGTVDISASSHTFSLNCTTGVAQIDGTTVGTVTSPGTYEAMMIAKPGAVDMTDVTCEGGACTDTLVIPGPSATLSVSPSSRSVTVGVPFTVDVIARSHKRTFNAFQADAAVSSNLTVSGIYTPTSNPCNLQYTKSPSTSDPSFVGALFHGETNDCKVYRIALTPTATGSGTLSFTNATSSAYVNGAGIATTVENGTFTISAAPTTPTLSGSLISVTSPLLTYLENFTLKGTKDSLITHVTVNATESGSVYPTSTTWEHPVTLSVGDNSFDVVGTNDAAEATPTLTFAVNRHTLGDINGDGNIDIVDASLFAVDWGKTSGLTYALSDMNNDGVVNLTDLSILAKLEE